MFTPQVAMAVSSLDRNALVRVNTELIAQLLQNSATKILAVYDRSIAVSINELGSPATAIRWLSVDEIPDQVREHRDALWVYAGKLLGDEVLALILPQSVGTYSTEEWRSRYHWLGLRELADHAASDAASVAVPIVALANWHVTAQFCGRCGGQTHATSSGWVRRCSKCQADHFPRTDPAVIMAIVDNQDRLLLGNSVNWPENRYSTLAGFVEPGESLEGAVRREVHEESNVVVTDVSYFASQPWPFPGSLMLGFFGRASQTQIAVDQQEIRSARWFTRAEITELVDAGEITLPGPTSIARRLIETWRAGDNPL